MEELKELTDIEELILGIKKYCENCPDYPEAYTIESKDKKDHGLERIRRIGMSQAYNNVINYLGWILEEPKNYIEEFKRKRLERERKEEGERIAREREFEADVEKYGFEWAWGELGLAAKMQSLDEE